MGIKNLNTFANEIHDNAVKHGFWTPPPSFGDVISLCHSELSEALEAYRNNEPIAYAVDINNNRRIQITSHTDIATFSRSKPEGIAVEMADCIIRILDWCAANDIDIETILIAKHMYNQNRPFRHGGKRL